MDNDLTWEFNCPQFVDFLEDSLENDDGADAFFDVENKFCALRYYNNEDINSEPESECAIVRGQRSMDINSNGQSLKRSRHKDFWPKLKGNMAQSPIAKKMRFSLADAVKCHPSTDSIRTRLRSYRRIVSKEAQRKPITSQVDDGKEFDFIATLRQYKQRPEPTTKGVARMTSPSPFKLSEPKAKPSIQEYKSMAQAIKEFQSKTPARFHTRKAQDRRRSRSSDATVSSFNRAVRAIREVCSPKLLTKLRQRPVTCLSREQEEELELENIRKFQFHAKPINRAIFERGDIGVRQVPPKPNTVVQPFNLHVSSNSSKQDQSDREETIIQFHARPVPKAIFEKPAGLREIVHRPPTIPQSPKFILRERNRENSSHRYETRSQCSSLNSTATNQSSLSMRWDPKPTIVKPFSFDIKDVERLEKKKAKIKEIYEEEKRMREFHANPMPSFESSGIPKKKAKSPTKCEPFHIIDEVRPMKSVKDWEQEVQEELRQQRMMATFKASRCVSVYAKPFIPQPSDRNLTEPAALCLKTEERFYERQKFEACLKEKETILEERIKEQQQMKEREEEQQLRQLRAATVHVAQPVRRYKALEDVKVLPLTTPISPCFQTNESYWNKSVY